MSRINPQALTIMEMLSQAGYEVALVGGAVRDMLLGVDTTDYDFTTNATPEEILKVFDGAYYENQFGTVSLTAEKLTAITGEKNPPLDSDLQSSAPATSVCPPLTSPKIIDLAKATKLHSSLIKTNHPPCQVNSPSSPENQSSFPAVKSLSSSTSSSEKLSSSSLANQLLPSTQPTEDLPSTSHPYEITTYRTGEVYDGDWRRPTQLNWGTKLEEDLARRDFTINTLALKWQNSPNSPSFDQIPLDLIDLFDGRADLEAGLIRAVGDPEKRFEEDALRMMRAVRFSVQLNFAIEDNTWRAIIAKSDLIAHVSWERLRDEFWKMLASDYPAEAIQILADTGLLRHLLPELLPCQGVEQSGHHTTDVWVHSLDSLAACPSPDPLVRFATLLHDVGKPNTCRRQNNKWTFYNHQIVGAKTAAHIARRLRLSRDDQNRLYTLVRYHMFHYQPENTDASIRRFMRQVGLENLDDILALREADRLGSGARKTSWRLEEMKERMIEQLNQPLDVGDLAINGHDLMQELKLQPGPIFGQILNYLLEQVLDNSDLNNRDKLLELARNFWQNQALPQKSMRDEKD